MKRVLFVAILAVLALAGCGGGSESIAPRSATQVQTLITGSGTADEVSRDFDVPADCPRQVLSYSGELIDGPGGFVNFRVYDTQGNPADSAIGPADLDDAKEGSGMWSLDSGTYSIEITSAGADWSYRLRCR